MPKTLTEHPSKHAKRPGAAIRPAAPPAELLVRVEAGDPIAECAEQSPGEIEVDQVALESPALKRLKESGVRRVAPLILNGKLAGLLNLGPSLYEQELSARERLLLTQLAGQAVSATRVVDWLRDHPADQRERARLNQDLRIARMIQEALLPREFPDLPGWEIKASAQAAEIVGGDFFDFLELADGRQVLWIGDVCSKGIPSALLMAVAHSILRAAASEFVEPGRVLKMANELLVPEAPRNMLVTCFFGVLNPASGRFQYANAGHPLPIWRRANGEVAELNATGMPLGLLAGMEYPTREVVFMPGEEVLFFSDGISDAHNSRREMVGLRRIREWLEAAPREGEMIPAVQAALREFVGANALQEDDITLLALARLPAGGSQKPASERWLASFDLPSQPGNERLAAEKVVEAVRSLNLTERQLDRLRTAVSETALNAMEHGNRYQKDRLASFQVGLLSGDLLVRVTDSGGGRPIPQQTHPDLQAKLAGLQSPRGWGLFLIRNMVDEMRIMSDENHHVVELVLSLKGETYGS